MLGGPSTGVGDERAVREHRGNAVHERVVHVQVDQALAGGRGLDEGNAPLGNGRMADDADQTQLAHSLFGLFNTQLAKALLNQGQANGEDAGKIAAGAGDDLVLMANIHDAAGNRTANGSGHGDRSVDVGSRQSA